MIYFVPLFLTSTIYGHTLKFSLTAKCQLLPTPKEQHYCIFCMIFTCVKVHIIHDILLSSCLSLHPLSFIVSLCLSILSLYHVSVSFSCPHLVTLSLFLSSLSCYPVSSILPAVSLSSVSLSLTVFFIVFSHCAMISQATGEMCATDVTI